MKINIEDTKTQPTTEFPYIVKYGGFLVLITGETNAYEFSGIMINGNEVYKPFQYKCNHWMKSECTPFHGQITISN